MFRVRLAGSDEFLPGSYDAPSARAPYPVPTKGDRFAGEAAIVTGGGFGADAGEDVVAVVGHAGGFPVAAVTARCIAWRSP